MIKVTVQNLKELKKELIQYLGTKFITELEKFSTQGLNQSEVIRIKPKAHPLAMWWQTFNQDIQNSESNNQLMLSEYSLKILDFLDNLETAQKYYQF